MKIKSNKKTYLWLGVFGSLALVASSSAILANSLSHNNNPKILLKNNYNFTSKQQVISSFQKADIEEELIALYLNELEKVSTNSFHKSMVQNSDFIDVNLQIQNEISSRLVTRNYSEGQVREQIGFVKNILFQNILAYENLVSSDDYDQIMKIEFFKYNFDEWSNLNNVEKYKYIYNCRESFIKVIQGLLDLKKIKQEIMRREFLGNNEVVAENTIRVSEIDEKTRDVDESIAELNSQIDNINRLDSKLLEETTDSWNNFADLTTRYNWVMGTGSSTVAAVALSMWCAWFMPAAILSNIAFKESAAGFRNATDNLGSREYEAFERIQIFILHGRFALRIMGTYKQNGVLSRNFIKITDKCSKALNKALAILTMLNTIHTMTKITDNYNEIKYGFKFKTREIETNSLNTSFLEKNSIASQIKSFDNEVYLLMLEKNNLINYNNLLKIKNRDIEMFNRELDLNYSDVEDVFSYGNLIQKNSFIKRNSSANYDKIGDDDLKDFYINLRLDNEKKINELKSNLNIFENEYSYNDKNYWRTIFEDIFMNKINILNNLFYI
ncbi:hypothetical protein [Spiroplasma alleghenense]|uniref:Transmembrane protein n=1 Tax=Spiroplasma alleghenense TaxID=216931 RepID=A0A345Z4Q6_9MOLU|nr:hypothetical protein [Spiroplasma alleghenense]AXK51585.1 hypothetical protein SALLE_v1c09150 [Spiroplasma alleghenense]